jgi:apolipoprotein N-acyltransferase
MARRFRPAGNLGLALASGALLASSFPKFGHAACAWVALAPLLVAVARTSREGSAHPPRRAALGTLGLGLATGVVYFAGTLYWVVDVMVVYGGLALPVAFAVAALFVTYLAVYPALFAWTVGRLYTRAGGWALGLAPAAWVATELARAHLLTGFPWVLLGASQVSVLPVAQLASVTGVYGLSLLVAASGAALAWLVVGEGRSRIVAPLVVAGMVGGVAWWGQARIARGTLVAAGEAVRVAVVQGNVAQDVKWDERWRAVILERYLRLSDAARREGAELIVWPESSVPFYFEDEPAWAVRIRELARAGRVHLIVGSDEREFGADPAGGRLEPRYYNAAFLVRPDGTTGGVYRKMRLVPFGEYVPLGRVLFFVAPLVEAVSSFSPGERAALLPVGRHAVSVAICYEVVYPDLIRRFVREGGELIATITNDAWFGRSSAAYQHFAQASLRAVEQGRYLVRAANTGISGVVDPYGRVLVETPLFETAVRVAEVRFLETRTPYSRAGDVAAYLCAGVTVAVLGWPRRRAGGRAGGAGRRGGERG